MDSRDKINTDTGLGWCLKLPLKYWSVNISPQLLSAT